VEPTGIALSLLVGAALGFFGGGGSILTVPLLAYVFGLEPKAAIASSLLIVGMASALAASLHARAGNVELRTALRFGSAGVAGAYLGGRASAFLDGALLLLLFAAMMLLTALAMWRGRRPGGAAPSRPRARHLAHGFGVGLFSGLVGAGGGFLIVPALTLWAGLPLARAVGTSLLIIAIQSLAGFAGYAGHVRVDYALVAVVGGTSLAGALAGAQLARHVDPSALRRGFAGLIVAMACLVLFREADVWLGAARESLPHSAPQVVFALVVLGVGVAAGRSTRRAANAPLADRASFSEGAGI